MARCALSRRSVSTGLFLCKEKIPHEATLDVEGKLSSDDLLRLASIALQRSIDPTRRFLMALSKAS